MKSYTLPKINGKPQWDTIPVMPIDNRHWCEPVDIRASAQLCWDDDAIYVHLMTSEKEIRAELTGTLADVWEDSCLEFFMRPMDTDTRYLNMEWNLNTSLYLGIAHNGEDLTRIIVSDQAQTFAPAAQRTEDGWEITFRVPFTLIRMFFPDFVPKAGLQFWGNCYKCGDLTPHPHFFAWSPIEGETESFHQSQYFGRLILGE